MKKTLLQTSLACILSILPVVSIYANVNANTKTYANTMAAIVNDRPILESDLNQAIMEYKSVVKNNAQNITRTQVLSSLITRELQLDLVQRSNITPKDDMINQQLLKYAESQGFNTIQALQKNLDAKSPYSFAALRQEIIDDISIEILRNSQISQRITLTESDVDTYLSSPEGIKLNQNEYQTVHIRVPFPAPLNELTNTQLESAQETAKKIASELRYITDNTNNSIARIISKHQPLYPLKIHGGNMGYNNANSLPINLASKIIALSPNQVNTPITTAKGIDIIKLADKKVPQNMLVPQWRVRHILIATDDYQSDASSQYKINGLYRQLQVGVDFAKLAAIYSNDPGSAGKGGDLNWVSEGVMVDEFEQVMKKTPLGSFSQPFKTQFGWHVLQIVNQREYDASNDIRRKMAREILYKRMEPQATQDWINELKANAYISIF